MVDNICGRHGTLIVFTRVLTCEGGALYGEVTVTRIMTDAFMRTRGESNDEFNPVRYI